MLGLFCLMNNGYIKLWRKIKDNPYCRDPDYLAVWVWCLVRATHRPISTLFQGERLTLKPGQFITSRRSLSEISGVQESKIERILKRLKSEQQIEQQKSNRSRLITILNWDQYQSSEQQIEQPLNSQRTTDEQPVNTNKNVISPTSLKDMSENEPPVIKSTIKSKDGKLTSDHHRAIAFNTFRQRYNFLGGRVRGNIPEYENFLKAVKKHKLDLDATIALLPDALEALTTYQKQMVAADPDAFVPQMKNLQTWINNQCWTEEYPEVTSAAQPPTGMTSI